MLQLFGVDSAELEGKIKSTLSSAIFGKRRGSYVPNVRLSKLKCHLLSHSSGS